MLRKLVFALTMVAATPAMATPTTLTLSNVGGLHGTYYGTFNIPVSAGSFSNAFTFALPSPLYNITTSIVSSIGNTLTGGGLVSSNVVALTGGTLDGATGTASSLTFSQPGVTSTSYEVTFPTPIRAGWNNPLTVSGFAAGANTYNISIEAIYAVPEPATWAMMIGGFAVIAGAVALQRRRAKVATPASSLAFAA